LPLSTLASHEFRTPWSTILSSTSLISHYDDPKDQEKRHKHINRISSSAKHLTSILNAILSLSQLEEGHLNVKPQTFDLVTFKQEISEEITNIAKSGQHCAQLHKGETTITNDPVVLRQILYNLLSNEKKYSPENSTVAFSTKISNGLLIIAITDHGQGIPESNQPRMFEGFFRAENPTNIRGTSLGLNIVKRQTELLGFWAYRYCCLVVSVSGWRLAF
jgi:K+-sensing histidine kinase KdpD